MTAAARARRQGFIVHSTTDFGSGTRDEEYRAGVAIMVSHSTLVHRRRRHVVERATDEEDLDQDRERMGRDVAS